MFKASHKNPGILTIEGNKFYWNTITVPKEDTHEEDTQNLKNSLVYFS